MGVALNNNKSGFSLEERFNNKKVTDTPTHTDTYTHTDKAMKENKTKRTYGMVRPSVFEKVTKYAKENDTSYNDIVCTLLDEFIEKNGL